MGQTNKQDAQPTGAVVALILYDGLGFDSGVGLDAA